jgi:hypothetical protein
LALNKWENRISHCYKNFHPTLQMPLRTPPARLLVGAGIMLLLAGVYIAFFPRVAQPGPNDNPSPSPSIWTSRNSKPVPPLVKLTAESDRDHYYLGENPVIRLTVENRGRLPFQISAGGDYRAGTRFDRFKITVRDSSGKILPDPMPDQMWMGGLGGMPILKPGDHYTLAAPLLRYALIEKPGLYSIEISHDFGWKPTQVNPLPVARLKLRFSEPDAVKAQAIAALAGTPYRLPSEDTRSDDFGDYTSLRHPIYLPFLETKAVEGTVFAVLGIGHIKGRQATSALLNLAVSPTSTAEVRLAALEMLAARASYPPPITHYSPRLVISADHLRVDAWNDTLRTGTFRLVHDLLSSDSSDNSDLTPPALDLLSALGTPEDAPQMLSILEANLIDTLPGGGVSHPQNQRIHKSLESLRALRTRGWTLPASPTRLGEIYLTFYLVEREQLPVTPEIEKLALAHLDDSSLIVRRSAYDTIRHPVPEIYLRQVRADFALDTLGLRDGVRSMIWKTHDLRLLPDLLARLENNRDHRQQRHLIGLSLELAGPRTVLPIFISQLNQTVLARETLDELTRITIADQPSSYRETNWTQADLDTLQTSWREFYARHEESIVDGKKFSSDDHRISAALFGGRYDWTPRLSILQ